MYEIQASYYTGKKNQAIHRDLFPWATKIRWGELSVTAKKDITTTFSLNLLDEILQYVFYILILLTLIRLQPQLVVLGIEDDLAKILLPDLKWQLLHVFQKGTKIRINKSWGDFKCLLRKKILFIQSTPARFPFSFLLDSEKTLVGLKIQQEFVQNNVTWQ